MSQPAQKPEPQPPQPDTQAAGDSHASTAADTLANSAHLADLRRRIDEIDQRIVQFISQRGQIAAEIGALKAAAGVPVYAPDREQQVYEKLTQLNPGPFPARVLHAIYRELMSGTLALERPQRIAYLGPRGSFSHLAATAKFGASVEYEPIADIPGVFAEVAQRHCDFAVVPIENSTGGGVIDTLDAFIDDAGVQVCAEINVRIHHNLLSRVPVERIAKLYSKPEIFDQCKRWLLETGLLARTVAETSSSRAAERAASEPDAAAIGSELAAELYDLPVSVAHVEDNPNNITRFLVLGLAAARPTGADKTIVMFTTVHRAGALVDVLDVLRKHGVNLTMITSRPSRRKNWEYCFFIDADGHVDDEHVARALSAAREHCMQLTVLGAYPRAPELG